MKLKDTLGVPDPYQVPTLIHGDGVLSFTTSEQYKAFLLKYEEEEWSSEVAKHSAVEQVIEASWYKAGDTVKTKISVEFGSTNIFKLSKIYFDRSHPATGELARVIGFICDISEDGTLTIEALKVKNSGKDSRRLREPESYDGESLGTNIAYRVGPCPPSGLHKRKMDAITLFSCMPVTTPPRIVGVILGHHLPDKVCPSYSSPVVASSLHLRYELFPEPWGPASTCVSPATAPTVAEHRRSVAGDTYDSEKGGEESQFEKSTDLSFSEWPATTGRRVFTLTDQQQECVNISLSKNVSLVQGPPGTGKSVTISNLVLRMAAQHHRVLVVASSNQAVDLLARMFYDSGLRVVRPRSMFNQSDCPILASLTLESLSVNGVIPLPSNLEQVTLLKQRFLAEETLSREEMVLIRREQSREFQWTLQNCDVVCTTFGTCSNPTMTASKFTHVIVDEAAQATE